MIVAGFLLLLSSFAQAQSPRTTQNMSVAITLGATFQTILTTAQVRIQITIQNNNTTTDNCWVHIGPGTPTTANSILLTPGQAYTRYYPYIPSDAIQATCATTNNTLYVDIQ
jgi:hypothetical protein